MRTHVVLMTLVVMATAVTGKASIFKSFLGETSASDFFGGIFSKVQEIIATFKKSKDAKPTDQSPVASKPKFCKKRECPPFAEKNSTDDYELRCYEAAKWVSTKANGHPTPMGQTSRQMFKQLFQYIEGNNVAGQKIDMTVPVLNSIAGSGEMKDRVMSFYIPEKFQAAPPAPKDPQVYIETKKFCAYVRSFGGYVIRYSQINGQAMKLAKALKKDGLGESYKKSVTYYAGYDEPWAMSDRHNEVMLMKV
uniref:Heme-binding protein 1-like protein n=1 Tax=Aurelia aurita TaxID=6145 RepID=S5ZJ06_AURAU|nr:heme-binding protein 1-like protein [Aurelia aurita]